jgi:hypothetical protein
MKGSILSCILLDVKQAHVEQFTAVWIGAVSFEDKSMRARTHTQTCTLQSTETLEHVPVKYFLNTSVANTAN